MKRILLIFMMICFLFGCEKEKENEEPLQNGINEGVKDEGYTVSKVEGKLKYESDKYVNNKYDNEIPDTKNVKSFEYLEDNYVNISFDGNKDICKSYYDFYKNKDYEIVTTSGYDFINDYDYDIHTGIKNNLVFILKCKKDTIVLRVEERR